MVQINLPKNSKVQKGNYFKDKTGSKNLRKVNVYRWDPSTGENPRIDTYEVDMDNCPSKVLDVLIKIKNEIDESITQKIDQHFENKETTSLKFNTTSTSTILLAIILLCICAAIIYFVISKQNK